MDLQEKDTISKNINPNLKYEVVGVDEDNFLRIKCPSRIMVCGPWVEIFNLFWA